MKGISQLLATLILIAIVVGVGIVVAFMSGAMVQRMQPSGSALTIQSIRAQAVTSNKQIILVEVVATVNGLQSIALQGAWLYWDSEGSLLSVSYSMMTPSADSKKFFSPGSTITIQIFFNLDNQPKPRDYAPISLIIKYKDTSGNIYSVSGSTVLEPYSP